MRSSPAPRGSMSSRMAIERCSPSSCRSRIIWSQGLVRRPAVAEAARARAGGASDPSPRSSAACAGWCPQAGEVADLQEFQGFRRARAFLRGLALRGCHAPNRVAPSRPAGAPDPSPRAIGLGLPMLGLPAQRGGAPRLECRALGLKRMLCARDGGLAQFASGSAPGAHKHYDLRSLYLLLTLPALLFSIWAQFKVKSTFHCYAKVGRALRNDRCARGRGATCRARGPAGRPSSATRVSCPTTTIRARRRCGSRPRCTTAARCPRSRSRRTRPDTRSSTRRLRAARLPLEDRSDRAIGSNLWVYRFLRGHLIPSMRFLIVAVGHPVRRRSSCSSSSRSHASSTHRTAPRPCSRRAASSARRRRRKASRRCSARRR